MVVVDDNPEVIVEDPNELLTPDEGFQEVRSKKTQKERLKAQEAERKKQETQALAEVGGFSRILRGPDRSLGEQSKRSGKALPVKSPAWSKAEILLL